MSLLQAYVKLCKYIQIHTNVICICENVRIYILIFLSLYKYFVHGCTSTIYIHIYQHFLLNKHAIYIEYARIQHIRTHLMNVWHTVVYLGRILPSHTTTYICLYFSMVSTYIYLNVYILCKKKKSHLKYFATFSNYYRKNTPINTYLIMLVSTLVC